MKIRNTIILGAIFSAASLAAVAATAPNTTEGAAPQTVVAPYYPYPYPVVGTEQRQQWMEAMEQQRQARIEAMEAQRKAFEAAAEAQRKAVEQYHEQWVKARPVTAPVAPARPAFFDARIEGQEKVRKTMEERHQKLAALQESRMEEMRKQMEERREAMQKAQEARMAELEKRFPRR